jgi:hypothetical protein
MLDQMNDAMVPVQVDQIQRKQYTQGMNSARRHHPDSFIGFEAQLPNQPSQARKRGIRGGDAEAEEGFPGLVIYAILPSFHKSSLSLTHTSLKSSGTVNNSENISRQSSTKHADPESCSLLCPRHAFNVPVTARSPVTTIPQSGRLATPATASNFHLGIFSYITSRSGLLNLGATALNQE